MLVVLLKKKQIIARKYQALMIKLIKPILIQKTSETFVLLFGGNVMFNNEDGIQAY